jgi:hypothetical protein
MNIKGFNSFSDCCSAVDGYTGCIFTAGLGFTPNKPGPNSVIFVSSVDSILAASQAGIWS